MSTDRSYPRVLVISAVAINSKTATGITLQNLFFGWPKECLSQIYDDDCEPDASVCGSYKRFGSNDIHVVSIIKKSLKKFGVDKKINSTPNKSSNAIVDSNPSINSLSSSFGDIAPFALPRHIIHWINEFEPDLIYSVLGSIRMINLVQKVNKICSVPIVTHFMDDWPDTIYSKSYKLYIANKILNYKIKDILSKSSIKITICQDMANEFTERYGGEFTPFMNCVEIPVQIPLINRGIDKVVRFGFVGGLHLNRWKSLITVLESIQKIKDNGKDVVFDIIAPEKDLLKYGSLFKCFSVVGEMKSIKADEVNEKLGNFDILVHVESFANQDSLYTRLSVSTKIPQYMAAARPILAYGPANLSSIRYVERTGSGLVVGDEEDRHSLYMVASQLMISPSFRLKIGLKGFLVAQTNHNATTERIRFHKILSLAAIKVI